MPLTIDAHKRGYCLRCGGDRLSTDMNVERWCASCMDKPVLVRVVPKLTDAAWNAMAALDCRMLREERHDRAARVYEERRARETTFHKSA